MQKSSSRNVRKSNISIQKAVSVKCRDRSSKEVSCLNRIGRARSAQKEFIMVSSSNTVVLRWQTCKIIGDEVEILYQVWMLKEPYIVSQKENSIIAKRNVKK